MNEVEITAEPARKHARIADSQSDVHNNGERSEENNYSWSIGILCLPPEILFTIFTYLEQKHLDVVKKVCKCFRRTAEDPRLWLTYMVSNINGDTRDVIESLKKMSLLRKIYIEKCEDCDDVLRQLSLTNKNLEELHIYYCTGGSGLYLRSQYMIRILERCRNLHTINICDSRFRGKKLYRLIGDRSRRFEMINAPVTCVQFIAFVEHAKQISEQLRSTIASKRYSYKGWKRMFFIGERSDPKPKGSGQLRYLAIDYIWQWVDESQAVQKRDKSSGSSPSD